MPDPEPKRGVWAWIASVAPPQELDEIARAIGRKTIDRNAVSGVNGTASAGGVAA